jgi:mannosyltransferase
MDFKGIEKAYSSIKDKPWFPYLLLILITGLAAGLRFYKLGEWSFWIDEIFTIESTPYLHEWPIARLPIYLVMIRSALEVFGTSEWSARFVPALIGTFTIHLLYFPVRRMFTPGVALLAVLLLTISPWHIYWSQNARFYTLLLFLYSAGSFLFFFGFEKGRIFYLVASVLFFVLVIRERESGFFFVPVIFAYVLISGSRRLSLSWAASLKTMALITIPIFLYTGYDLIRVFLLGEYSYFVFFLDLFFDETSQGPFRLLLTFAYRVGIPMIIMASIGGIYLAFQKHRAGLFIFLSAVVPPLLLLVMSNFMFTVDRYIFIALPFWAILTAYALYTMYSQSAGFQKFLSLGVIALVLVTYMGENYLYFGDQQGNRPNWREAYNFIDKNRMEKDLIASTRPQVGEYYLEGRNIWINNLDENTIIQANNKVWFLIDEESGYVKPDLHSWILENAALEEVIEVRIPGKSLNIRIYSYSPSG